MESVELILRLPPDFARDAQEFDLLDADAVMQILRTELDERIMKFVDNEVKNYRDEQRAKDQNK